MRQTKPRILMLLAAVAVWLAAAGAHAQELTKIEQRCSKRLSKAAAKLAHTRYAELARCLENAAAAGTPAACPDAKNGQKITKAEAKLSASASKSCGSVCSISTDVPCVSSLLCPPLANAPEKCTAGAKGAPFDMRNLGFPGALCEAVLGGPILRSEDIAECVRVLTEQVSDVATDVVYGDVANGTPLDKSALGCLHAVGKAIGRLVGTTQKGIAKCRDKIAKGKTAGNPATCATDDVKLAAKIAKVERKLVATIAGKCSASDVLALDVCGNGPGGTTQEEAETCLVEAAEEITDSHLPPALRQYSGVSLVDAVYPPGPVCGDDVVNQGPNAFLLLGEECDGSDDAACPGDCFPPGDLFECTCATIPRIRFLADGPSSDLDLGWTGTSHDQKVADFSGYVTDVSGCDCDQMTAGTCTGSASDPVCDQVGRQQPTCSWDVGSATTCDQHGNDNGSNEDLDCFICDAFSANAGAHCVNEASCDGLCYDAATGLPSGPCQTQGDCSTGEICRGQCDRLQHCVIVPYSAPVPISSGGTPVCSLVQLSQDVVGTENIVTGEHSLAVHERSLTHTGVSTSVPCPVCGGFCQGGPKAGALCQGTCTDGTTRCRFESDCGNGEHCTTASPECPGQGFCNLSLVCGGGTTGAAGPNEGSPCRVEATSPSFGTTSNDCPPDPNNNVTGDGLQIDIAPQTSELVTMPATLACTAPGYELFECECPDGGGRKTQPNACNPACNAGAELGLGCADGNGTGEFTTCDGGDNAGRACDDDADCSQLCSLAEPGTAHRPCTSDADCLPSLGTCIASAATCSVNPTHCVGDPDFEHFSCSVNADCGAGTCVDACPSGRCVPLCLPSAGDPFEGQCAAGPPSYHCSGAAHTFLSCSASAAAATCDATCSQAGTACTSDTDCPGGERCEGSCPQAESCEAGDDGVLGTSDDKPGAGSCVADPTKCFQQPISAEGGDVYNGNGDATNVFSVGAFCIDATTNTGANFVSGIGGPGRLRIHGVNIPNFTALPTVGACCDPGGACALRASSTCTTAGSTFLGGPCTPNPCP
jgi:hypothetical protein